MKASLLNTTIFETTACISPDQLRRYAAHQLNPKELRSTEEHLADCELCFVASEGFLVSAVTSGDLKQIQTNIDSVARANLFSSVGFKVILSVVLIVLTVTGIWKWTQKSDQVKTIVSQETSPNSVGAAMENHVADAVPDLKSAENRVVNESYMETGQLKKTVVHTLPSAKNNVQDNAQNTTQHLVLNTTPAASQAPPTHGEDIYAPSENTPQASYSDEYAVKSVQYNRPLIFINGLKVSDYTLFYLSSGERKPNLNAGVSADREGNSVINRNELPGETERIQSADAILRRGLFFFKEDSYEQALGKFTQLLDLNKKDVNALFYSAVCFVRLKRADKGLGLLEKVLGLENNAFAEEALWFKVQGLLMKGDSAGAKETLKKIVAERGFYAHQAREKLASLN
jgi:hypothetical protein